MHELYTMADMATILKTPDSTVRSWCNRFEEYVPYTGEGREKRYLPEALTVLRVVADCYAKKMTTGQIAEFLAREFPRTISADGPQQPVTVPQQQDATAQQQAILTQQQAAAMMMMAIAGYQKVSEELQEIRGLLEAQHTATREHRKDVDKFIAEWREKQKNRRWWRLMWWRS